MNRAHRTMVPHCCFCFAGADEAELMRDKNSITGAVMIWCADAAACRKRGAYHPPKKTECA